LVYPRHHQFYEKGYQSTMKNSSPSKQTMPVGVGARISQVRFPFSQTKFASSLGIPENTLMHYEKEEKPPDSEFLTRIYEVYRVDPIWLLTGESAKVSTPKENIIFLRSDHPAYASCTFAVHDEGKSLRNDLSLF